MVKLYENNARFAMCDCVIRVYFNFLPYPVPGFGVRHIEPSNSNVGQLVNTNPCTAGGLSIMPVCGLTCPSQSVEMSSRQSESISADRA